MQGSVESVRRIREVRGVIQEVVVIGGIVWVDISIGFFVRMVGAGFVWGSVLGAGAIASRVAREFRACFPPVDNPSF